jgi:hypothetical protein
MLGAFSAGKVAPISIHVFSFDEILEAMETQELERALRDREEALAWGRAEISTAN